MDKEVQEGLDNIVKGIDTKIETKASELAKKEASEIKEEVTKGLEALKETLNKRMDESEVALKKQLTVEKKTGIDAVAYEIKENKESLKAVLNKSSHDEIEIKATTNRAAISDNAQAVELSDIGQLAHRKLSMYDSFPKIPISSSNNNGVIRYYDWDEATSVRAAAMVAEGGAFPESTAKWKTYTIDLKKIGDTLPVTEEFLEDETMFAAELNQFLVTNVDLVIDNQIANGDGTGQNLTGLVASVDAYSAPQAGIQDASIYDLIPKLKESITASGGSKYAPNVVFMNISDINKYKLKKDDNNNYVMPPFVSRDGNQIDGIIVIESNVITANTLVIGDNRYARIYEKGGITLSQGEVNAQFTSDMKTLKARKRLLFLIRNADKGAWKKVTDIDAALVTLASSPA